jgi:hypothetical protein
MSATLMSRSLSLSKPAVYGAKSASERISTMMPWLRSTSTPGCDNVRLRRSTDKFAKSRLVENSINWWSGVVCFFMADSQRLAPGRRHHPADVVNPPVPTLGQVGETVSHPVKPVNPIQPGLAKLAPSAIPPAFSKTVTACPSVVNSHAVAMPATPAPMTAILNFLPCLCVSTPTWDGRPVLVRHDSPLFFGEGDWGD